jgi:hypothetical protein
MTVGQVLEKSEDELLSLRNFGRKSYDELKARLRELSFLPSETAEEELGTEVPSVIEEEGLPAVVGRGEGAAAVVAEPVAGGEEPVVVAEEAPPAEEAVVAPAKRKKGEAEAEEPAPVAEEGEGGELAEWQRKLLKLKAEVGGEGEG